MPTINIDGRGTTPEEAVQDMWKRMQPLTQRGYTPVSQVEIVDTKTKQVIEHFLVSDPEFAEHTRTDQGTAPAGRPKHDEHKPPSAHEYPFLARVTLEG